MEGLKSGKSGEESAEFSIDVSESRLWHRPSLSSLGSSEFSTDVSETRKQPRPGGEGQPRD